MSVLVAIPVFERERTVRLCFRSAAEMELPAGSAITVFDDASPTLQVATVLAETGLSADMWRSPERLGASRIVTHVWQAFLASPHTHLLFLDSDMIANRTALADGLAMATDHALLTLYNSRLHPGEAIGPDLLRKSRLGNAGTLWSRGLAERTLGAVGGSLYIDDRYSEYFAATGVPMLSVVRSRLQHLGVKGEHNGHFGSLEHGLGFVPDSPAQWAAIAATYDELMSNQSAFVAPRIGLRLLAWKVRKALGRE